MTNSTFDLSRYKGFLLDVDGVLVWDHQLVPGAAEAVRKLQERGRVLFLSNSSAISQARYTQKLNDLGIATQPDDILNSAVLVARYLSQQVEQASVFVIGHDGLRIELEKAGHYVVEEGAEWMVTGTDQNLTYDTLTKGLHVMVDGARWVASNADATYLSHKGTLKPGAGSVLGAFRGMGFEPEQIVGKPSEYCMYRALDVLGIENAKKVLCIGDRLDSDIEGAHVIGADSALVMTGVTSEAQLKNSILQPDFVFPDIASIVGIKAKA